MKLYIKEDYTISWYSMANDDGENFINSQWNWLIRKIDYPTARKEEMGENCTKKKRKDFLQTPVDDSTIFRGLNLGFTGLENNIKKCTEMLVHATVMKRFLHGYEGCSSRLNGAGVVDIFTDQIHWKNSYQIQ